MHKNKKFRVLNIIGYLLLTYQLAILVFGFFHYHSIGHVHDGLYVFSFLLIYLYIFSSYTKAEYINSPWHRWLNLEEYEKGEIDYNRLERWYYINKGIILALAIILSFLAVLFALINMIQKYLILYQFVFSFIGISALLILILSLTAGIKIIIKYIQKPWMNNEKGSLIFRTVILQNFLLATFILKMLSNAQI